MACPSSIAVYNFTLYQGDDETLQFRYRGDDGSPIDITGYIINLETATDTLRKTATIVDATDGRFDIPIAAADTQGLGDRKIPYEIVFIVSGARSTKFKGHITIEPEVYQAI